MSNNMEEAGKRPDEKRPQVPVLRFPEFTDPWEEKELKPYLEEYSERVPADTDLPIFSSTRTGLKFQKDYYDGRELVNGGEYGVVPDGFFVYRHMSDDGTFKFNINRTGQRIAVSKEYPVFTTVELYPNFLLHKINDGVDFKRFALMQKKGGTRTRLYFATLCSWKTLLPTYPEQQKIADCLSSIDELITLEARKIDALKAHKNGLMQQLFPAEGETLPKLRFPEFRDAGEWNYTPLHKLAKRCIQKNHRDKLIRVLTNSAEYGVVDQRDYFDKDIANQGNLDGYFIVEKGDYVYNPRISISAKVGPISRNEIATGIMSPLYTVFRFKSSANDFFAHYFKSKGWHHYMRQASNTGARHDRMAISNDDFMAMPLPVTSTEEQQKIADCLSSIDDMIALQAKKLDTLKAHKKGLMQQLFPSLGEVRE